jgi:hypothetical protein
MRQNSPFTKGKMPDFQSEASMTLLFSVCGSLKNICKKPSRLEYIFPKEKYRGKHLP